MGCLFFDQLVCFLGDVVVDQDAAAMFADDDFLVHLDFALALWGDFAEAAAAGFAVEGDNGEAVAGLFADALVGGEVALVDELFLFFGFLEVFGFLFLGVLNDAVQLFLLGFEVGLTVFDKELGGFDMVFEVVDFVLRVTVAAFAELDFEVLEFDFFVDGFEFAVVAHVVLLFLVFLDHGLVVFDFGVAFLDGVLLFVDVGPEVVDTCLESCNLVFQVLNGLWQFTADDFNLIDFRIEQL